MNGLDPIKHVVVLMLENHSFDQILGWTKEIHPGIEGIDAANPHYNAGYPVGSAKVFQSPTRETAMHFDPRHDLTDVLIQIENKCDGFVSNFARAYPKSREDDRIQIMAYYPRGALPVVHALAENFAICDHWYSSLPGPTWPNRFFVHTGTCLGHVKMPSGLFIKNEHFYDQNTIYDELDASGIHDWGIYHHGMPQTLLLARLWDKPEHFHSMETFFEDARGPVEKFPRYAFIEPSYGGSDENDQHPCTDIRTGEFLIAQVYNALRANEALWNSTLLVLLYDEHGGFYDHLNPPKAVPPDECVNEYSFDQYGVRVPAILISPWIETDPLTTEFDHTSLLKYLIGKWGLRPDRLGRRVEEAATFGAALQGRSRPRTDTPGVFDLKALPRAYPTQVGSPNELQQAHVSFSHFLEKEMAHVEEFGAIGYRSLQSLDGAEAQLKVAKDRCLLFLHHARNGRL